MSAILFGFLAVIAGVARLGEEDMDQSEAKLDVGLGAIAVYIAVELTVLP